MMKQTPTIRPRAALLIGAAFLATPAFAQDAQTLTPPPIQAVAPAPAPVAAPPERVIQIAPAAPVVQAVPETPKPQTPPAYATRSAAPAATRQTRTVTRTTTARAPVAAAPVRAVESNPAVPAAPVATAPEPAAVAPPAQVAPVETAPEAVTTTQQTTSRGSTWPWLLGALALAVAAIAAIMLGRRRRDEPEFVEERDRRHPVVETVGEPVVVAAPVPRPVSAAPVAIPEPVIAGDRQAEPKFPVFGIPAPVAEPEVRQAQGVADDELAVHAPEKADLAGVADGTAPVARRPWLELGMRPVRAGTNKDEAVADIELTVGNSGDTAARDVRISTFMLADAGTEAEMERLLAEHRDDSAVPPVTIEPGEGTRIDAHLAASKEELGRTFNPVIVAEARYTLPDGRQGRTSAAFKIGCPSETGMRPLAATRPFVTETVEAELFGTPERA